MRYIPNTDRNIAEMLAVIGAGSVEDLFSEIPADRILKEPLRLPPSMPELELLRHLRELEEKNTDQRRCSSFLGGGSYNHFIPAVVSALAGRSEFVTSYTPYQPEISQGTLQAIFEYQTFMCLLTGMDVSNASMYDGASGTAEAVLMALRIRKKGRVVLSSALHPDYRAVVRTYCRHHVREIVEVPFDERGGTDIEAFRGALDEDVACAVVQSPNFLGIVERLDEYGKAAAEKGALFIVAFTEPLAYGLLRPPGSFGADIVCGEGQSLGIPPAFGGPHLGILTARKAHMRNLPGRIVGKGVDRKGRTAFVLTLTAREQHIRREKATSNICTNEGHCALTAAVYCAALGKGGFQYLARLNNQRAEYARDVLSRVPGVEIRFNAPVFNEFVVRIDGEPEQICERIAQRSQKGRRILAGIPLGRFYESLADCLLLAFTEMNGREDIDELASALGDATGGRP